MKAVMVMFDSLRKDLLSVYGGPVPAPNFERLMNTCVRFDNCYAGSLPCMPARRELHTGRYNFLHRSWGPLEPFDDSMPAILKENGIYTHLATDHYHYLQDGGATYQGRYSSWFCARGQESDCYIADLHLDRSGDAPNQLSPEAAGERMRVSRRAAGWQNMANREVLRTEADWPMRQTFDNGLDFLDRNHDVDRWFLQIETFDPHEPFTAPDAYKTGFCDPDSIDGPDWPQYADVRESGREVSAVRQKYFALVSFCDDMLGRVLDRFDRYGLWDDTLLIVNTDHGFLLAEHGKWGKGTAPNYNELVNIPFFIHDPSGRSQGVRKALVQTIDIAPTILDHFGIPVPEGMRGKSLLGTVKDDRAVRDCAIFGYLGGPLGITDGHYVLLHDAADKSLPVYEYTLMPTHMKDFFSPQELSSAVLCPGFGFTRGLPVLKIRARINPRFVNQLDGCDLLFDLDADPHQERPVHNEEAAGKLLAMAGRIFDENEAPAELYEYFGLKKGGTK